MHIPHHISNYFNLIIRVFFYFLHFVAVKSDFYIVGDKLKFRCPTGYKISDGDEERTCLANGLWSGYAPNCQYIECGDIPKGITVLYLNHVKGLMYKKIL